MTNRNLSGFRIVEPPLSIFGVLMPPDSSESKK
jgi:hypothetical protein